MVELTEAAARVFAGLGARAAGDRRSPTSAPCWTAGRRSAPSRRRWRIADDLPRARRRIRLRPCGASSRAAAAVGALDLARHQIERDKFKGRLARLFAEVDLILVPAMYLAGPTFERMSQLSDPEELAMLLRFTAPFDMIGQPDHHLALRLQRGGLPVGFQLIGPHLAEGLLLRAGHAYQQASAWHSRHPEL